MSSVIPASCARHRHPTLRAPVAPAVVLAELDALARRAGIRAELRWEPRLSETHRRNERRYAEVDVARRIFYLAPEALWLPRLNRVALLAHEVGHVLRPRGDERAADRAARGLGVRVGYDRRWSGRAPDGRRGLQVRKNSGGFGMEDLGFESFQEPTPTPPNLDAEVLRGAKRGDVVAVGRTKWHVFRVLGSYQAWVYKHGTEARKIYDLAVAGRGDGTAQVWLADGAGGRVGDPVAVGPARVVGFQVLD